MCISGEAVDKIVDRLKIGDELSTKIFDLEDVNIFDLTFSVYE
ncbi:hypothetical protein NE686_08435 [Tissierella carlieri]|uniref:Uncharacterized protein n=1 Tax=Tissierella carlieri TaxID=689904 RepID=A0ABT1S9S3_9FIRM|nr:hypothetical protein [Tissierella carlieri]MCQ4923107.1 hypothetical protein [Tissierella carlieri]